MKRIYYLMAALLFSAASVNAQVIIGSTNDPQPFSVLELESTTGGLRLPQLTTEQRDALEIKGDLAKGLMIYNTDIDCIEIWMGQYWVSNCGDRSSDPASFDLNGTGTNLPAFTNFDLGSGASVTLSVFVNDTEEGNQFTYQWYSQPIRDQYENKGFTKMAGKTSNELTVSASSSRSNIRYYCEVKKVDSKEVKHTGTCRILVGGCGAEVGLNGAWVEFQCHNLGAATESTDPFTPSEGIHGAYFQFGSKTPVLTRQEAIQYSRVVPFEWPTPASRYTTADWEGDNDPCPVGWKLLTVDYADKLISFSNYTPIGHDWDGRYDNFSTGIAIGDYLFIPTTGWRPYETDNNNVFDPGVGGQASRGYNLHLWTNKSASTASAYMMRAYRHSQVLNTASRVGTHRKENGFNVRCVADN